MTKKQLDKTKKKLDIGKLFAKIMCFSLAMLMVLGVAATLIFNLIYM